ncbi:MAG: methylase, partial [Sphingobium sp.]|nr:methylase [Sphingobium sp.]
MTLPLFATQQPDPDATRSCAQRLFDVATMLADSLAQSQIPDRHALRKLMTASFGASDAQGAWSMRQAYDALEIGLIMFLRRGINGIARSGDPTACYAALRRLETSLPTHSYRSEQQIAMQQFSTPLALAWLAVQAARLGPEDHILEPSAGTGMLLGSIPPGSCTFTLNERDPDRAALLTLAI